MNRKQLAEMIKKLRKKALKEVIGLPAHFNPEHGKAVHGEEPNSPNQYAHHKMKEEVLNELGGTYHKRRRSIYKQTLGNLRKRNRWLHAGQQKMRGRYTEEEVEELGPTDTGKKSKSEKETVDINPTISSAQGETTKNTTIKERKEK